MATPPVHPDLSGQHIMLIAPAAVEASLLARQLICWGARTCMVPDAATAATLITERPWSAVFVDHALGRTECEDIARMTAAIGRRIVLITPAARHELPALKEAGFTGYLVKPVRSASLAARLAAVDPGFDRVNEIVGADDAAIPSAAPTGAGRAILIAEDNDINALLTRTLLSKLGHHPTVASNGADAVAAWRTARAAGNPYDLVLMDVHMPGSDGLDAARRIRALESDGRHARTPIIALTANAFSEDRDACLAAGMDGFLVKPLDRDRLTAAIAGLDTSAIAA